MTMQHYHRNCTVTCCHPVRASQNEPVASSKVHAHDEISPVTTNGANGELSILVIDNDEGTAGSYAALLGLFGHQVRVAADGPTALHLAADAAPDVVLLDVGQDGMDGYAVATELCRQSAGRRPVLIAVTGPGQGA